MTRKPINQDTPTVDGPRPSTQRMRVIPAAGMVGTASQPIIFTDEIPPPDVKAIRESVGLSQAAFAWRYRIPIGTLRSWELGTRPPDQAAAILLYVIGKDPGMVAGVVSRLVQGR